MRLTGKFLKQIILRFVFFLLAGFAIGKPGLTLSTCSISDQNAFRNYEALSEVIVQPEISGFWVLQKADVTCRFQYDLSFLYFQNFSNRHFHLHEPGLYVRHLFNQGSLQIYYGITGGFRKNRSLYSYYNYARTSAYLNAKFRLGNLGHLSLGMSGQWRRYQTLKEFDFNEVQAFVQQNFYFPTKTSAIFRMVLGMKQYMEPQVDVETITELIPVEVRGERQGTGNSNAGRGNNTSQQDSTGRGNSGNNGSSNGQGQGRGQRGGQSTSRTASIMSVSADTIYEEQVRTIRVVSDGKRVSQMRFSIRLAQSVGSKTGLAVQGLWQRHLDGLARSLSYQDGGYEEDDMLFDDIYSYEKNAWLAELTQRLPWRMLLKFGVEHASKWYLYDAYDMAGVSLNTKRQDQRFETWLQLRKSIAFQRIFKRMAVVVFMLYVDNGSNDLYYDYDNVIVSAGWEFGF